MKELDGLNVKKTFLAIRQEIGTLLFAEFPTTVLYINSKEELIIKEWADCSDDGLIDRYYFYKTDKLFIRKFLKNEISHFDLIQNSIDGLVYFQDISVDNEGDLILCATSKIERSYLPSAEFKLNIKDVVDYSKIFESLDLENVVYSREIIDKVKEYSIQNKTEIFNLHIKKGNGVGFGKIKTETLGKTLIKFENLYENVALDILIGVNRGIVDLKSKINKEKSDYASSEVVYSMAASFSVLIRPFQTDITLFDSESSSEKIAKETFSLLNNSTEMEDLKTEYQKHSEFTISAYKGFLKEIYSLELELDLNWVSNKSTKSYSQKLNHKVASKIIIDIENLNTSSEDHFKKKGKFRAFNCDTGHFNFISNDEEHFTGYFAKQIREGSEQIVFTKIYEISIDRKVIKDAGKDEPKIQDTIIGFYEDE